MVQRTNIQQFSFNAGILSADMSARLDLKQYHHGAQELLNMVTLPQGGIQKRMGLEAVDILDVDAEHAKLVRFEFADEQNYLLLFTDYRIAIYYRDILQLTIISPFSGADLQDIDWTQSLDTMIITHPAHHPQRLMRQGGHDMWQLDHVPLRNIPQYQFSDSTNMEPVWSEARGYPRSVYFFQGRLFFGGSYARPQTIWGSRTGDFFNFATSDTEPLDDDALELTLDGERINAIQKLYALSDLLVFTSGGLYAINQTPITPENFFLSRQNEREAAAIKPVLVDDVVHYISHKAYNNKQAVLATFYDEAQQGYASDDITKLVGDLVNNPQDMAGQNADILNVANRLFIVNGDGTIAVLNSLRNEKILGWTKFKTMGKFKNIVRVDSFIYVLVERHWNGDIHYTLEKFTPEAVFDHNITIRTDEAVTEFQDTRLTRFMGEEVSLFSHGSYLGDMMITSDHITTAYAVDELQIGFNFEWRATSMPIEAHLSDGTFIGNRHRITKASVQLYQTTGLAINQRSVDLRHLDQSILDQEVRPFDGIKTVRFLGWYGGNLNKRASISLSGYAYQSATILSLITEVAQ
jgi:hypothetical protein